MARALGLFLLILAASPSCRSSASPNDAGRQRAVAVAWDVAAKLGYQRERMVLDFDDHNTRWLTYLEILGEKEELVLSDPVLRDKLAHEKYWAMYLSPLERGLDLDLWVFVRRSDAEVLGIIKSR